MTEMPKTKKTTRKSSSTTTPAAMAKELAPLRAAIDDLDNQIIQLLNRRAAVAQRIGRVKDKFKQPAYVPERERQVLDRLVKRSEGPLSGETLRLIYKEIMSASRALESPLQVAFLGPEATFTHTAGRRHFGSSAHLRPCASIAEVFDEVTRKRCQYGVVPFESSSEGLVYHTLDNFIDADVSICAEVLLPTAHQHVSRAADLRRVKRIYGEHARFLVIGNDEPAPTGEDRTSIMFALRDAPGVLHTALQHLVGHDINMLRIESRPVRDQLWDYIFFIDLEGHAKDANVAAGLEKLAGMCVFLKVLGSYPRVTLQRRRMHASTRQ